jgi:hypothetical protein
VDQDIVDQERNGVDICRHGASAGTQSFQWDRTSARKRVEHNSLPGPWTKECCSRRAGDSACRINKSSLIACFGMREGGDECEQTSSQSQTRFSAAISKVSFSKTGPFGCRWPAKLSNVAVTSCAGAEIQ